MLKVRSERRKLETWRGKGSPLWQQYLLTVSGLYWPCTDVTPGILWHNPRIKCQECHGIIPRSILNKASCCPAGTSDSPQTFRRQAMWVLRKPWQGLPVHTHPELPGVSAWPNPAPTSAWRVSKHCPITGPDTHRKHVYSEAYQAACSWKEALPQTLCNCVPLGRLVT